VNVLHITREHGLMRTSHYIKRYKSLQGTNTNWFGCRNSHQCPWCPVFHVSCRNWL